MKSQSPKAKVNEDTFKSFNNVDLSKIKGTASEIFTSNFERFNACKTFDDVVALCHELLDDAGLDTNWTRKFFFQLDQIKNRNPNPRRAYEQALLFVNNARMRGMGLGMNRGAGFYEEEELNEGWIGGILGWISGGLLAGLAGLGLIPAVALVAISTYGGHKIQQYFSNKNALKNLDDSEIAILAALAQNGAKGLTKEDVEKIATASKTDAKAQFDALNKLVDMGAAVDKGGRYVITQQGRGTLQDAGFNQEALNKDAAELQKKALNESMDDTQKEEFKQKLREGKVEFKYKKKDGTERKAVGTMDPKLMDLPEKKTQSDVDGAEKKKTRKLPSDSVFYYDLEAKGFRSFKMENFIGYV